MTGHPKGHMGPRWRAIPWLSQWYWVAATGRAGRCLLRQRRRARRAGVWKSEGSKWKETHFDGSIPQPPGRWAGVEPSAGP